MDYCCKYGQIDVKKNSGKQNSICQPEFSFLHCYDFRPVCKSVRRWILSMIRQSVPEGDAEFRITLRAFYFVDRSVF